MQVCRRWLGGENAADAGGSKGRRESCAASGRTAGTEFGCVGARSLPEGAAGEAWVNGQWCGEFFEGEGLEASRFRFARAVSMQVFVGFAPCRGEASGSEANGEEGDCESHARRKAEWTSREGQQKESWWDQEESFRREGVGGKIEKKQESGRSVADH